MPIYFFVFNIQQLKMASQARKVFGAFEKRAPGPKGTDNFQIPAVFPPYFVRKTTLKFTRKSQQHMKVHVGSNEIFSSVFFARSFESFFIHLLLSKRFHIFQFTNITSVLAIGKFIRQRALIFRLFQSSTCPLSRQQR